MTKQLSIFTFFAMTMNQAMALEIKTSIVINTTPDKVWKVLTDFEKYPDWNPFLKEVLGEVKEGNRIKIVADGMKFKPKILTYTENKELKWRGRLLLPGLFDGKHCFVLIDNGDGSTTLEHSEKFSGILVPFLKKKLRTETKANFEKMNQLLKERVEKMPAI